MSSRSAALSVAALYVAALYVAALPAVVLPAAAQNLAAQSAALPLFPPPATAPVFGASSPGLDSLATCEWWGKTAKGPAAPPTLDVPLENVVAFALYPRRR